MKLTIIILVILLVIAIIVIMALWLAVDAIKRDTIDKDNYAAAYEEEAIDNQIHVFVNDNGKVMPMSTFISNHARMREREDASERSRYNKLFSDTHSNALSKEQYDAAYEVWRKSLKGNSDGDNR